MRRDHGEPGGGIRRQFADGNIMAGTKRPDYGRVIDPDAGARG